jgi:DUF1680 family protein
VNTAASPYVRLRSVDVLDTRLPNGARVVLEQETDYPWDGHVRIDVRLVPYYAWGNRAEGEMTVWIPLLR